jgi:hypothetical protein
VLTALFGVSVKFLNVGVFGVEFFGDKFPFVSGLGVLTE